MILPRGRVVPFLHLFEFGFTSLMRHMQHILDFSQMWQRCNYRVIYCARTLRSAENEQVKAFRFARLRGNFKELTAYRIARQNSFAAKVGQSLLERNSRFINKPREHSIRPP